MLSLNEAVYAAYVCMVVIPLATSGSLFYLGIRSRNHSLPALLAAGITLTAWIPIMVYAPKVLIPLFYGR